MSANAAESIFSAIETRQLAGKKHTISCSRNINTRVAIFRQLNLELVKCFYSQLRKPAKEVSL